MESVLLYAFIAFCAFIVYKNRRSVKVGVLTTKAGKTYTYAIGNYLKSETMSFNGVDITLPYKLANFYLDSHIDSKHSGPGVLYDRSQMISLEGNFDKYFQLFAPRESAVLVLSVLSPDVMQTLMDQSSRYDVELFGNHLRLIAKEKMDSLSSPSILRAAEAIIEELDHRATSWQPLDTELPRLMYKRGATLKLLGRYLRRSRVLISILGILLFIVAFGMGLAVYYTMQNPHFSNPYSKGSIQGTFMYAAAGIIVFAIPVVMLAPLVWFSVMRPDKAIFPSRR